jgi:hypothetical protein
VALDVVELIKAIPEEGVWPLVAKEMVGFARAPVGASLAQPWVVSEEREGTRMEG